MAGEQALRGGGTTTGISGGAVREYMRLSCVLEGYPSSALCVELLLKGSLGCPCRRRSLLVLISKYIYFNINMVKHL